jgi:H+/gluconate symporter-like permease
MDSFFKALVRCALWLAVALCLLGGLAALLACLLPGPAPTARAAIAWAAAVWYLAFAIWISWLRRPKAQKG